MLRFMNNDNEEIVVLSFEEGLATIEGYVGVSILSYLKKTLKMWPDIEKNIRIGYEIEDSLEQIRTKLNGSDILLKKGEDPEKVYERWKAERIRMHYDLSRKKT